MLKLTHIITPVSTVRTYMMCTLLQFQQTNIARTKKNTNNNIAITNTQTDT